MCLASLSNSNLLLLILPLLFLSPVITLTALIFNPQPPNLTLILTPTIYFL